MVLRTPASHNNSITGAKRACRRCEVLVDGTVINNNTPIRPGQLVQLQCRGQPIRQSLSYYKSSAVKHDEQPLPGLQVVYEDEHIACVVKPRGLATQGGGAGTAQGRLKYCLTPTTLLGALQHPQQAHRLDALTGGLLLAAKTRPALQALCLDFEERRVKKRYVAVVKGAVQGSGTISLELDGRPAETRFEAVCHTPSSTFGMLTTVNLFPLTGRTHQLRKHMAYTGTPILGDPRYRGPRCIIPKQQGLPDDTDEEQEAEAHEGVMPAAQQQVLEPAAAQQHAADTAAAFGALQQYPGTNAHQGADGVNRVDCSTHGGREGCWDSGRVSSAFSIRVDAHGVDSVKSIVGEQGNVSSRASQDFEMTGASAAAAAAAVTSSYAARTASCRGDPSESAAIAAVTTTSSSSAAAAAAAMPMAPAAAAAPAAAESIQPEEVAFFNTLPRNHTATSSCRDPTTPVSDSLQRSSTSEPCMTKAGDTLADGTRVSLCLWATDLWLLHPVTKQPMHLQVPEPAIFETVRDIESQAAAMQPNSTN